MTHPEWSAKALSLNDQIALAIMSVIESPPSGNTAVIASHCIREISPLIAAALAAAAQSDAEKERERAATVCQEIANAALSSAIELGALRCRDAIRDRTRRPRKDNPHE